MRYEVVSETAWRVLFADERRDLQDWERLLGEITSVFAESFSSTFYADGAGMDARPIRSSAEGEPGPQNLRPGEDVRSMMARYARDHVAAADRAQVARLGDMDYVRMLLERENPVLRTYRAVAGGRASWRRVMIAPFDGGRKYVFAFEDIDRQVQTECAARAEKERLADMLEVLSRGYVTLWFLDGKRRGFSLVQSYGDTDAQAPSEAPCASLEGRRILLAEDIDLNAEIAVELLAEMGFLVDRASGDEACVAMLSLAPAGTWDAVLMDIQMPKMDGCEATRAIRALGDPVKSGIPILAMTANAFKEDADRALSAGMNGHIAKPFSTKTIRQALSAVLPQGMAPC